MKQATKRFISLMVSLALIALSIVVFSEFVQSAYQDSKQVKGNELAQENFLKNEQGIIKRVQQLISNYQGQEQIQQAISASLPLSQDLSGALFQISGLVKNSGLGLSNVSISVEGLQIAQSSASGNQGRGAASASIAKPLGTIVLRARISGTYDDLKRLVSLLDNNVRIFDIRSLNFQPSNQTGKNSIGNLDYDLTVATYYQTQ